MQDEKWEEDVHACLVHACEIAIYYYIHDTGSRQSSFMLNAKSLHVYTQG